MEKRFEIRDGKCGIQSSKQCLAVFFMLRSYAVETGIIENKGLTGIVTLVSY
jgi:hypothetical protein